MAETFQEKFERLKRSVDEAYDILKDIDKNHFFESEYHGILNIMLHNMINIRALFSGVNKIIAHLNTED